MASKSGVGFLAQVGACRIPVGEEGPVGKMSGGPMSSLVSWGNHGCYGQNKVIGSSWPCSHLILDRTAGIRDIGGKV